MKFRLGVWLGVSVFIFFAAFLLFSFVPRSRMLIVRNDDVPKHPSSFSLPDFLFGLFPAALPPRGSGQLLNPPTVIKAVYATNWVAGNGRRIDALVDLIRRTELNAVVIDIKDFSGVVGYATSLPQVKQYRAEERRIRDIDGLLRRLHENGIYAIGRIVVFQDQKLTFARPDLAVRNRLTGEVWRDRKGLAWVDPAAVEAWDYNIAIAKDALARGFDEINLDYIRFPSDGALEQISYPFWNASSTTRAATVETFLRYLRAELPHAAISGDIFGLAVVDAGDMGIGQVFERMAPHLSAVAPMMYPSHYHAGFAGYREPAKRPYEVVRASMESALKRLPLSRASTTEPRAASATTTTKLRPWLQDFDLGASYDAAMVRAEIRAVYDSFCALRAPPDAATTSAVLPSSARGCDSSSISDPRFGGWMLWSPDATYTGDALEPKKP